MKSFPVEVNGVQVRPFWIAHLDSGKTITEKNTEWDDLPTGKITSLQLQLPNGRKVTVSKRGDYKFFQMKQAVKGPGVGVFEGIVIGSVINDSGDCFYIFVHRNGNILVDTDNIENPKQPYFVPMRLNKDILK